MIEIFNTIIEFIESSGLIGAMLGSLLIIIESMLPVLPLMVFITINFLIFGNFIGFIISWFFTIIGCVISYTLFRNGFSKKFNKYIKDKEKLKLYTKRFNDIKFTQLTILIAIPFTPAFLVNIAAGLVNMNFKKYFYALLIGKVALVYFWGFIGTSFIDSLTNPIIMIRIIVLVLIAYLISKIVDRKLKLK